MAAQGASESGGGVCGSVPVRQQQGPGLTWEESQSGRENTALVLPSRRGLCLWPAAVAGRPEGAQGPSSPLPMLPSTASGFQLWVGSAAYPVSLVGHTDLLPPPGPPEPFMHGVPFSTHSHADSVLAAEGPAGSGAAGSLPSWGLDSDLGGSPQKRHSKATCFQPLNDFADLTSCLQTALGLTITCASSQVGRLPSQGGKLRSSILATLGQSGVARVDPPGKLLLGTGGLSTHIKPHLSARGLIILTKAAVRLTTELLTSLPQSLRLCGLKAGPRTTS